MNDMIFKISVSDSMLLKYSNLICFYIFVLNPEI